MMTTADTRIEIRLNSEATDIKWGDIVYVDFGKGYGSEQGGIRPAIIVQNNKGNSVSPCTIVAPMTSEEKNPIPTHIIVHPTDNNGLKKNSTIMFEQIRTIDKSRIISKIGRINMEALANRIQNSLSIAFSNNFC